MRKCILCMQNHPLASCQKFKEMKLKDRIDFVRKKELCFGCLGMGHLSNRCLARKKCDVCQLKHPTLLHDPARCGSKKECSTQTPRDNQSETPNNDTMENSISVCNATESSHGCNEDTTSSMILPVWLYHQEDTDNQIMVYALFDPASNGTFIKTETLNQLGRKAVK